MSSRRLTEASGDRNRLLEEDYRSHFIGDTCQSVVTSDLPLPDLTRLLLVLRNRKYLQHLHTSLRKLIPDQQVLSRFPEGTIFYPNQYPAGTILRLTYQRHQFETHRCIGELDIPGSYQLRHFPRWNYHSVEPFESYYDEKNQNTTYGVVGRDKQQAVILAMIKPEHDLHKKRSDILCALPLSGVAVIRGSIRVGEWLHSLVMKESESYSRGLGIEPFAVERQTLWEIQKDVFRRFVFIDIMQMGKGEKRTSRIPRSALVFKSAQEASGNS